MRNRTVAAIGMRLGRQINVRLPQDGTEQTIDALAAEAGTYPQDVIRAFVMEGLAARAAQSDRQTARAEARERAAYAAGFAACSRRAKLAYSRLLAEIDDGDAANTDAEGRPGPRRA